MLAHCGDMNFGGESYYVLIVVLGISAIWPYFLGLVPQSLPSTGLVLVLVAHPFCNQTPQDSRLNDEMFKSK